MPKRPGKLSDSMGQATVPPHIEPLNPQPLNTEPSRTKELDSLESKPMKTIDNIVLPEVSEESNKSWASHKSNGLKVISTGTPSKEIVKHAAAIGGIDISDPFEIPKPGLLISKGHVNGIKASFLFDTGCMGNVISLELCQKIGIKYRTSEDYDSVMANETVQEIGETTEPVAINLGSYTECMRFIVSPLRYSVIFGKKWETKYDAKIDCSNNQICFRYRGSDHVLHAIKAIEETSLGSLVNDYKKGFPMYSVLLHNQAGNISRGSTAQNTDITAVLSE